MQQARQHRIDEHRQRTEDRDAGHGIGDVFIAAFGDGVGRDHGRGAADRRAGRNQFGQLAFDADHPAHPFGEQEGRDQRGQDHACTKEADLRHLRGHQLQTQQNDAQAQDALEAEDDTGFGPGRRADQIVEQHADQGGQDHRAEDRHPRNLAQQDGQTGHPGGEDQSGNGAERAARFRGCHGRFEGATFRPGIGNGILHGSGSLWMTSLS